MNEKPPVFVTARELSAIISMPVFTIRKLAREGIFTAYRLVGNRLLFKTDEIINLIETRRV